MPQRIFVTGTGMICALGQDVEHALFSLRNSVSGIGELRHIETIHKKLPFGEVKFSDEDLIQMAGITSLQQKFSRTALLGIIAATEAVKGKPFLQTERVGIVSATTVGGMPLNEKYYKELLKEDSTATFIESLDCTENTEQIADRLNIRHYLATISTACSSSANAIMVGARLLKHNRVDKVLVGGTDALTRFTLNGFNSLEILSNQPCKPFDEYRNGTTIGEGAGFLLLETEQTADPANIICEIAGYGNANDAYHITAPSPDGSGSYLAMKRAFESAQNNPFEIDYVNAHGTGTPLNDMSEIIAMEKIFNGNVPYFSSTKSFTGHTLAAAGAIEAIISTLAIKYGFIPPNLNFIEKMKNTDFHPVSKFIDNVEVKTVLTNSFGFGGNNTSLILKKV